MVYFYAGEFLSTLKLDADDLGMIRGYSAFEYIRTYNKVPFCLEAHLLRFLFSMEKLGLNCPYTFDELKTISLKLASLEEGESGIKWYATGGKSPDGLRVAGCPTVFAFTQPNKPLPEKLYIEGVDTLTSKEKRPLPEAKTTAYLPAVQLFSSNPKIQEILYLNEKNELLEASTSNLFFVKGNTLITPKDAILHGITREVVLTLARDYYPILHDPIRYSELSSYDEAFLTATNKEILPIRSIDGIFFKKRTVTEALSSKFKEFILRPSQDQGIPLLYLSETLKTPILLKT